MVNSAVVLLGFGAGALLVALIGVAVLSRHKKSATTQLRLMDRVAVVETTLEPEGSVLAEGELWRARSPAGLRVERGERVRVVGAAGHLLEVEPLPTTPSTSALDEDRVASVAIGYADVNRH